MATRNLYEGCCSVSQPIALLDRLSIQPIVQTSSESLSQSDPIHLTSYDLLPTEGQTETIIVPGSPAVWSPQPLPIILSRDAMQPLIREAFPSCPMEPLFRAISITAPETDLTTFDIITDRRNLRMLMDFVIYRGQQQQEFRFDVEIVGNSLILSRWVDWESRRVHEGYGKEFESKFTKHPNCSKKSLVHKRAVGYTLGGLRMMVRFEVDACLEAPVETSEMGEFVITPNGHKLQLKGAFSNAEGIVEIKTSAITVRNPMGQWIPRKALPQMWLSRTPILCQGFHKKGVFERIGVTNLQDEGILSDWENRNKERIGKLVQVLRRLKTIVKEEAAERFAIVCEGRSTCLKLYRLEDDYLFGLPQDLREKWSGEKEEEVTLETLSI